MFSQMLFRRSDDHPGLIERRFLRLTFSATIFIRFASSRRRDRAAGGRWIEKEGVGRNGTTWRFGLRSTPCSVVAAQDILRDDRRLRGRSGPDRSAPSGARRRGSDRRLGVRIAVHVLPVIRGAARILGLIDTLRGPPAETAPS